MTTIGVIIILLVSAFFSGMEIAFVSSNKLRMEMDKASPSLVGRALNVFYTHPSDFISTLLIGNNIALVIYGILMASIIEMYVFGPLGFQAQQGWVLLTQTILSTLVVLVVGEYLPKTLFRINPNGAMRLLALPALCFYVVLYPVSRFTSWLSRLLLRLFGVRIKSRQPSPSFTKVDLDHLIQSNIDDVSGREEIEEEVRFFQNALEFRNVKVRECIVPRNEIDAVSVNAPLEALRSKFVESGKSKIIIFREDMDDIVGFVHNSEMFRLTPADDWTTVIREASIVPETMSAQKLLQSMLQQKRSIAIVVDEFGGTSGIVTLEDLVEEICGEIEDEHDRDSYVAKRLAPNEYLLSARLEIDAVNDMFSLSLPTSEEYLTISGLILNKHQSFPKHNDVVRFDHWEFRILKSTSTKIELVRLKVVE